MDLLFPCSCVGCGCCDAVVCDACAQILRQGDGASWRVLPVPEDVPFWCVGQYCGVVRRFVLAAKHRDSFRAASWLEEVGFCIGRRAASCSLWAGVSYRRLWVVPAPSSWRRRLSGREVARPFACGVARGLAVGLGMRCEVIEVCRLRWGASSQSGRSGRARRLGRVGSMRARCMVPEGVGVVCVDDVVTTGATIREMARVLGCVPAGVIAVAGVS